MKRKNSLIALAAAVCVVMSAFAGCQKKEVEATTVPAETVAATEAAVVTSGNPQTAPVSEEGWQMEQTGSLKAWKLTPVAWSSNNGATVTLNARPASYESGMGASFVVRLNGEEVENKSCDWDGDSFSTAVDLSAEDGYEFEIVVFAAQKPGEAIKPGEHIPLTDAYMNLANLKSSLEPACTLLVDDYKSDSESFDILACFATVRLPQLSADGTAVTMEKSQIVLMLNGEEVENKALELKPDEENVGSFTASGSAISFKMPAMEDDYYLDLMMFITLSNGDQLSAHGGTWYFNNGALSTMSAG